MGHTRGRDVFSYTMEDPPRLILVDRNLIKKIEVKYEREPKMSIRRLFEQLEHYDIEIYLTEVKELKKKDEDEWYKEEKK